MVKQIETLVDDIYELLGGNFFIGELLDDLSEAFAQRMKQMVGNRVIKDNNYTPGLRMSNLGKPCERQVYLGIHKPEEMEPLDPWTRMKFLYGDSIEELLLFLCEAAGHTVTGMQDKMELEGVPGHRDAVIDGVLVDVKSASTFSFKKFKDGGLVNDDPFGYIGQIQSYLEASQDDPLVTDKSRCAFLVMDKTLGHICLDIHAKVPFDVREITRQKVATMEGDVLPSRAFAPVEDGKSGNMKLPMQCSYCNAKHACYGPELRTFLYSNGPRYLTKVVREPAEHVIEVK